MQAKALETSIETTRRELEDPSEVEIELKRRLSQLTDHLIQKQAQVIPPDCIRWFFIIIISAIVHNISSNTLNIDVRILVWGHFLKKCWKARLFYFIFLFMIMFLHIAKVKTF